VDHSGPMRPYKVKVIIKHNQLNVHVIVDVEISLVEGCNKQLGYTI